MNVFLLTDLEGVAGVDTYEQMDREKDTYRDTCALLERDINLAVQACFENGARQVYYMDGHGGGGNVRPENIDGRAVACKVKDWQALLEAGEIDCVIELGSHARAGTIGGFLDHTISSKKFFSIRYNGLEMSELSMHAIFCAQYGVPVVAVMGDEVACEQAKSYIPDIYVGPVKTACCRNVAETYRNADAVLKETIAVALKNYKKVSLIPYTLPAQIRQVFYRTDYCEERLCQCGPEVERVDARTLQKTITKISVYRDLRI